MKRADEPAEEELKSESERLGGEGKRGHGAEKGTGDPVRGARFSDFPDCLDFLFSLTEFHAFCSLNVAVINVYKTLIICTLKVPYCVKKRKI